MCLSPFFFKMVVFFENIYLCIINFSWTTWLLTFALVFLIYYLKYGDNTNAYSAPLPPSPSVRLPIFGHLYLMKKDMRGPLKRFRTKLGDVYSLHLGSKYVIIVSGYKNIKEMFVTRGNEFQDRCGLPLLSLITRNKGFVGSNGYAWKRHRNFTLSTLKDLGMGKSLLNSKLQEEAQRIVGSFDSKPEVGFDPNTIIMTSVCNVICHLVFADGFKRDDPRFEEMKRTINESFKYGMGIANYIPIIMKFPGDPARARHIIRLTDKLYNFIYDVIDEHEKHAEGHADSFVKTYLREMERQQREESETVFSKEDLASCFLDLFVAGTESTTTVLLWSIACLANFPNVQARMFTEIIEQVGNSRPPSVLDRSNIPFVEAFVNEVIRYCEVTILGLIHCANQDTVFHGYTIPKSAIIFPDMSSISMDVTVWGDPENFRPERFLDTSGKLIKKEENIPFFQGKRSCIAESLARTELFMFISSIVQRFKICPAAGSDCSIAALDGEFGVGHKPKPFRIIARSRQACEN